MTEQATPRPKRAARSGRKPARPQTESAGKAQGARDLASQLKRERILSAAIDLFYEQGYGRTTLDQIARALGVTKPFIYQYFDSKNDLLAEISSRAIWAAHETFNRTLQLEGSAAEKLRIIVREFMLHVLGYQANAIIYSREETELSPADQAAINGLRRDFDHRLVALLEEGSQNGEFAIADVRLTSFVIGSIVGWSPVWYRSGGRLTKEDAAENVAALILTMVGAQPAPPRASGRLAAE